MRVSKLISQTLREAPAEAEIPSHRLLLRAGFIRQLAAGIFTYMPLAKRSLTKIEDIMRDEINAIGGQELAMPVIHPAEIWQETERWYQIGSEMGRFKDKNNRDMVLAMTHEEVVADIVRKEIHSYRQLPLLIYHIQTKWRDDPRPRAGLIRVREFTMKDSYTLDADWEGLDKQYQAHYQAYFNIFYRSGIPTVAVKSDVGMMGGKMAHEFMYLTPIGEDTLLICKACNYAANRHIARFQKPESAQEDPMPVEKVATPDSKTIEDLANFLGVPEAKTAKAVFFMANIPEGQESVERFVFAVLRGDMELNEIKLANAIKASELRPATEEEIISVGAVPGYASPVGLQNSLVVVDDLIPESPNLVAGANEEGYHLKNVNFGRDYQADIVTDIAAAQEGDACPNCGGTLRTVRGVEVGNIFKLGSRYSDSMGCYYLDKDGKEKPVIMGSYGIGSGRLLACVAEEHHDEYGLIWPISVAPYHVHIVALSGKGADDVKDTAERLYQDLLAAGVEVLYDDRTESPGVKFNDADLIGLPIRLTVSGRSLQQGGIEFKRRDSQAKTIVPQDQIIVRVKEEMDAMFAEIRTKVVEVPFDE
ncbi:MAG: proline--tRNA ligase [Anaerolineales bacterium]|nr:proline--tRNA ligase [Anaerolineales bacterium]MCK5428400.1 proline--tRNA ligase [Anaerolineales bacterium]